MILNLSFDQALLLAMFADGCWHESDSVPDDWLPWFDIKSVDGLFDRETTLYRLMPEYKKHADLAMIYLGRQVPSTSGLAVEKRQWLGIQTAQASSISIEQGIHWLWGRAGLSVLTRFHQPGCARLILQSPSLAIARINSMPAELPPHAQRAWEMITADEVKKHIMGAQWAEVVVWG